MSAQCQKAAAWQDCPLAGSCHSVVGHIVMETSEASGVGCVLSRPYFSTRTAMVPE